MKKNVRANCGGISIKPIPKPSDKPIKNEKEDEKHEKKKH